MKVIDGGSSSLGRWTKSSMSLPEVKIPGCPVISTARTALSSLAASRASAIALYMRRKMQKSRSKTSMSGIKKRVTLRLGIAIM